VGILLFTTEYRPALGPTQPPIQWVRGALSLRVKRPGREADHSPPNSAEVKEMLGAIRPPQYVFMVWCFVKQTDIFTFMYVHMYVCTYVCMYVCMYVCVLSSCDSGYGRIAGFCEHCNEH
jgi:hypothetical protein